MLLTLIGPGTLIAPAPGAPKIAPSPPVLFQAAPDQLRLVVSHAELLEPLSQLTSAARSDVAPEQAAIAASVTRCQIRLRFARIAPGAVRFPFARLCTQGSDNMGVLLYQPRGFTRNAARITLAAILPA